MGDAIGFLPPWSLALERGDGRRLYTIYILPPPRNNVSLLKEHAESRIYIYIHCTVIKWILYYIIYRYNLVYKYRYTRVIFLYRGSVRLPVKEDCFDKLVFRQSKIRFVRAVCLYRNRAFIILQ